MQLNENNIEERRDNGEKRTGKEGDKGRVALLYRDTKPSSTTDHSSGTAWKVAYSDFITSMMALFMLLWILNSNPLQQFRMTSAQFNEKIKPFDDNDDDNEENTESSLSNNAIEESLQQNGELISVDDDSIIAKALQSELSEGGSKSLTNESASKSIIQNIDVVRKQNGIFLQISDSNTHPIFQPYTAILTPYAKELLIKIAGMIQYLPNFISISSYTAQSAYDEPDLVYNKWEISSQMSDNVRKFLIKSGISHDRFIEIRSYADSQPLLRKDPTNIANKRIIIALLHKTKVAENRMPAPINGLSVQSVHVE